MVLNFFATRFGSGAFLGESLWLGHFGHFFIVFNFFASLLACIAYFAAEYSREGTQRTSWNRIGRYSFSAQSIAVFSVFILLFIMILNHMFEYHYAWRHSSRELPLRYIISSFWEGQEGSFLLWMFWLSILGIVGIFRLKNYENPVMGVLSLTQVFLASMVMGVYIFGQNIGSNPFILLRDAMAGSPIFQRPDYLQFIEDGNGLNPLLQNYWMTIHPPALFLGFASVTVPFGFAVAGLLRKDWNGWVKPALPWTLFSVGALGIGIMMGGAWAYESLSFGGFWAWDPVENSSLVPWLMMVAALHNLLIFKYTKRSLVSTYLFFILAFGFVLYSTFLTRSGILGETSVHAFTDLGMTGQLLLYLLFFVVVSFALLIYRVAKKQIPTIEKEEDLWSREFWIFIGTLVLMIAGLQMTFSTSIPVWNKIFGLNLAPPENVIAHYNAIQIWLGILLGLLTGFTQYLSYKTGKFPSTARWALYSFGLSVVLAVPIAWGMDIHLTQQHVVDLSAVSSSLFFKFPFLSSLFLFLVASLYAALGNLFYLLMVIKGKLNLSGGSIAHFGFGVFLVGVILSQGRQQVISYNRTGIDYGQQFNTSEKMENILLLKDSTTRMGDYWVTYKGSEEVKPNHYYLVDYVRLDDKGDTVEKFTLKPNAQLNPKMGLIANPDTKHYLTRDVFTHVSSVPDNTNLKDSTLIAQVAQGDTFYTSTSYVVFKGFNPYPKLPADFDTTNKVLAGVVLQAGTLDGKNYTAVPVFVIDLANENAISSLSAKADDLGLTFDVQKIDPKSKKVTLEIHEKEKPAEFIIMKAIIFPYINLVWLGALITFAGAFLSVWRRFEENR